MESPNNKEYTLSTRHLLLPSIIYSVRNGLHLIELFSKSALKKYRPSYMYIYPKLNLKQY